MPVTARTPRRIVALLAAATLLAACADDEPDQIGAGTDEPEATEPDEPAEPEEPEDPFAIPDEIDEEYTQRVLDELLPIVRDAQLEALEEAPTPMPPDESIAKLRAVYTPGVAVPRLASLMTDLSTEQGTQERQEGLDEHGETRWVVTALGDASEDCIPVEFAYEFSEMDVDREGITALVPAMEGRDPDGHNPTPWAIGLNGPPDSLELDLDTICEATVETDEEMAEEEVEFEEETEQEADEDEVDP
jgi:hypothetical protein